MSTILAIDTATGPCSVAVWHDGHIAAYVENLMPAVQSACLMPMVEEALHKAGMHYSDLDSVSCTTGPGSFTGIRVGLAAARGIAFAATIPSTGHSTLEVMAYAATLAHNKHDLLLAVLNAGKGEVYAQYFSCLPQWHAQSEPMLTSLEKLLDTIPGPTAVIGNMPITHAQATTLPIVFPRADALAALTAHHAASPKPLQPFYIRPPDAKLPAHKPL